MKRLIVEVTIVHREGDNGGTLGESTLRWVEWLIVKMTIQGTWGKSTLSCMRG